MENQDTLKYMSTMIEHINENVSTLAINQIKLMENHNRLNEKIDRLDEKVNKNHEEVLKEIKGLREDVDTIYDLEMDTRRILSDYIKKTQIS